MTTSSTQERARETASTAGDETRRVAGVAADQAGTVVDETKQQARHVVDEATTQLSTQLNDQARGQRDRVVELLRSVTSDLDDMVEHSQASGIARDVASEISDRSRALTSRLEGREPSELLDDVRSFARRRPGTFLLGALAAGVVTGRVLRGARDASTNGTSSGTPAAPATTTATTPATPATTTPTYDAAQAAHVTSPVDPTTRVDPLTGETYATDPALTDPALTDPALTDPALTDDAGLGTPAAGYGDRGDLGDLGRPGATP